MTGPTFFPDSVWHNQIVDFQEVDGDNNPVTTTWKIKAKLEEEYHQGDEEDWKDFKGQNASKAIARFDCVKTTNPSEHAFMKVYMQIPYATSEYALPSDRAAQALPNANIKEDIALSTLTEKGSTSSPPLLNSKREIQDENSLFVPGGFLIYLVTGILLGTILEYDHYWKLDYDERTKIRLAFKAAYEDCYRCGIVHIFGFLGTNLLWNRDSNKIYILGFSYGEPATQEDAWDDNEWIGWGFGRPAKGFRNHTGPLPQNMVRGRQDQKVYEL